MLLEENERGTLHFKDVDWRLNMVTATRQKQRMFLPKYTMHIHLEKHAQSGASFGEKTTEQDLVLDLDYTNLKRLQEELQEAIKSVDGQYAKKVQKFIK